MLHIDLNCDLGEEVLFDGMSVEPLIMPYISSANIACGKHAGNAETMLHAILLAKSYGVAIGAHPAYDDRNNFGRKSIKMLPKALAKLLKEQIHTLLSLAEANGITINHVKAHGALYNDAMTDHRIAETLAKTVAEILPNTVIFGLPGSAFEDVGHAYGLVFAKEAFADRAYDENGKLVSRGVTGALISNPDEVIERCLQMVLKNRVQTIRGNQISIKPDTICLHGDGANAPALAKALRKALEENNIHVKAYGSS